MEHHIVTFLVASANIRFPKPIPKISYIQKLYVLNGKFMCSVGNYSELEKGLRMSGYEKTEKILKALACKSRLEILECIRKGVSNPGGIARKLRRHRSTVEKHLRVLLAAKVVEKVPPR